MLTNFVSKKKSQLHFRPKRLPSAINAITHYYIHLSYTNYYNIIYPILNTIDKLTLASDTSSCYYIWYSHDRDTERL